MNADDSDSETTSFVLVPGSYGIRLTIGALSCSYCMSVCMGSGALSGPR